MNRDLPTLIALRPEISLNEAWLDELRLLEGLLIRISDKNKIRLELRLRSFLACRQADESWTLDKEPAINGRTDFHWLYEARNSEFLLKFRENNPQMNPNWNPKHYLIVTVSTITDIIAVIEPEMSIVSGLSLVR
jgi:hypothetical protein